ncbi:hypothetical protein RvY_14825 [Ramazzottius varieornatus]|uniref:Uncharacterized protein n=1 Tax=Ramazzottius varieornatus TaxID=947166 RepID=A0A1D1VXL7_RAMVA|nr:hypothetical protein RvY_14825 [Ramazzottius varieornatus]
MHELDPVPDEEARGAALVSHVFLNYLQLSGLYSLITDKNGGRQKFSVQWCWVVAVAVPVLSLINFADYIM